MVVTDRPELNHSKPCVYQLAVPTKWKMSLSTGYDLMKNNVSQWNCISLVKSCHKDKTYKIYTSSCDMIIFAILHDAMQHLQAKMWMNCITIQAKQTEQCILHDTVYV